MAVYIVQPGDTLAQIAARFNTTVAELQRLNNLANPNLILVGQQLTVPDTATPAGTPAPTPSETDQETIRVTRQYSGIIRTLVGGRPYTARLVDGLLYILLLDQQVYRPGQEVRITLNKVNVSNRTITLRYNTGQRFELVVRRAADNAEVWRYSRGRLFIQQSAVVTIRPNQTAIYRYVWDQRDDAGRQVRPGDYVLEAFNVARGLQNTAIRIRLRIREGDVMPTPTPTPPFECTGANLLQNANFESWLSATRPRNWNAANVRRSEVAFTGRFAVEMGNLPDEPATLAQVIPIVGGSNNRVSFRVAEDVEGSRMGNFSFGVQVFFRNRSGTVVGVAPQGPFSPALIEDEVYELFSFTTGRVPATAVTAELRFTFNPRTGNQSRIRIDSAEFRCLSLS
ncbi:BsuPI-related putative proteinase inhibitor [Desulforamulus hydrothermalis]|uniref:Peptidoglycan-binding lysin domain protein n=1 Tax=Desulforamulus hydrothermalis Lam5 = DSM 18033 TaxID=1121428 RepID=K8DZY7_9FIRM|nr:BsuPI-related putative proteinase inhibitor [Desulforamulus hydrothermalis]CCO08754.1 Peptidoglycan-binding lysin domain protein [Desulforamulus hydrothermalis Lam5 = DSM 18033]SHG70683.1 LysM domain-containing protein [Desulforamulus hydrothermalis Lam5 = DSM 18033]